MSALPVRINEKSALHIGFKNILQICAGPCGDRMGVAVWTCKSRMQTEQRGQAPVLLKE